MRKFLLIFLPSVSLAVSPVITQSTPVINQGATFQFTETQSEAGTWACSATNSTGGVTACSGSITSGGLYTAPSTVTPNHTYGGLQVGPNNDVFNTRIDTLSVNANNASWIAAATAFDSPMSYNPDFPFNYVLPTGSSDTLVSHYTTATDGVYELPSFPNARAEGGWFNSLIGEDGADHHVIMVDTMTGVMSEIYVYSPNCLTSSASVTNNTATLVCTKNPITNAFIVGSTITVGSFTGGDTFFNVTTTTVTAVTSTSISYHLSHANATASTNGAAGKMWGGGDTTGLRNTGSQCKYSSMTYVLPTTGATDAAGMPLQPFILSLQELENAYVHGGAINHAIRNDFSIGTEASSYLWPATAYATDGGTIPFGARVRLKSSFDISEYSAIAQILLTQLKNYGMINADGGQMWWTDFEEARWPSAYYSALQEIQTSTIAAHMEFVDESGLMINSGSSLTKANREIVTFTRTSDSAQVSADVALQGPAVNFAKDVVYMMAGAPAYQLPVLNNFGGFSCSMSPSTGTLTSGCLYTPPATLTASTTTVVTATSLTNSSATSIMTLTVFPSTGMYIIPSQTSNYTDAQGNLWLAHTGVSSPDTTGCCACDNMSHFPAVTDVTLWDCVLNLPYTDADQHIDAIVPNGNYQVVYHYGTQDAAGVKYIKYAINGTEVYPNLDPSASAGGQYKLFTSTDTAVTNNQLQVGIYSMNAMGAPVSSLSAVYTGALPSTNNSFFSGSGTFSGAGTVHQ